MRRNPVMLSIVLSLALVGPTLAQTRDGPGLAGAYLSARSAVIDGNHGEAAARFERALAADPGNPLLIGNALFANAALGQWDRAAIVADMLDAEAQGQELSNLVAMVRGLRDGDLIGARSAIEAGRGAGPFIDGLALGWIFLGEGDMRRATDAFEEVAADGALADIAYTQLALARAAVGDFEGAHALFSGEERGPLSATERSLRARAEILVQLDRREDALALLDEFIQSVPDPALLTLRDRLATSETAPAYDFITTPQEGLADVFYSVARGLAGDSGTNTLPLLYARAAYGIDPSHAEALLFVGDLLTRDGQPDLAAQAFSEVPPENDQYIEAQLGRADALFEAGHEDDSLEVLQRLADEYPNFATLKATLGDFLRRTEQCGPAIDAYTSALDLVDTTQERFWVLHFTRGICYAQQDDFEASEADFRQALVLSPEQPQVLNNLGYALVERREKLDEALGMIERAVAARPDSGFITDSLGWALYRLERFEEAVEPMERAVELEPNDPIINDHLGDVYWMVGRYREAEFQWHRALSFEPAEDAADRIRLKLERGLYDVLEAEGGVGNTQ